MGTLGLGELHYCPYLQNPTNPNEVFAGGRNLLRKTYSAATNTWSAWESLYLPTALPPDILQAKWISSVAMSPSNPDQVFFALSGDYWDMNTGPNSPSNFSGIFRADRPTGGATAWTFTDITNNMRTEDNGAGAGVRYPITDICVSDKNPDYIWVSMGNSSTGDSHERVWRTRDGGLTWTNVSDCLTDLPVLSIAYQPDSPDRVFAATDIGVFFREFDGANAMDEWALYAGGGPRCVVADMEINRCSNTLYTGTHGFGLWEVPLPTPVIEHEIISTNTTYNNNVMMYHNLVIQNGATLTIEPASATATSPTLFMATDRTITVEPGGVLRVNNATITDMCNTAWGGIIVKRGAKLIVITDGTHTAEATITGDPDAKWGGIEVWGNTAVEHSSLFSTGSVPGNIDVLAYTNALLGPDDPGMVILRGTNAKHSRIENGKNHTITTDRRKDGYFGNTYYGGIIYAQNTTFSNCRKAIEMMKYEPQNYSHFKKCNFTTDDNTKAFEGITIWGCNGITINECNFDFADAPTILMPTTLPFKQGIGAFDAGKLEVINTTFHFLNRGISIEASNVGGSFGATITDNTFDQNIVGIHSTQYNLRVEGNQFSFVMPPPPVVLPIPPMGVFLTGQSNYGIAQNIFTGLSRGIRTVNTSAISQGSGTIVCNTFEQCTRGISTEQNNTGLHFLDNTFNTTQHDVRVASGTINVFQGVVTPTLDFFPYFNLFTLSRPHHRITTAASGTTPFFYFYHTDPANYTADVNNRLVPHCYAGETPPFAGCTNTYNYSANYVNNTDPNGATCIDLNGDGDPGVWPPNPEACKTRECYEAIKAQLAAMEEQKDGGDKQALLDDLYNSPEALETYQKYMTASPYLSDDVLAEVCASALMSPSRRSNILLANAPLSDSLMVVAYNSISPSVYQVLYALKYYIQLSERDRLDMRIGGETSKKEALLGELLQKYSDENDYANLESLLNSENTTYAVRALLGSKMGRGDWEATQSLLDALPTDTPDEQDYKTVQQINLQHLSDPAFALSEAQYQTLHSIADAYGSQAPGAQALLGILRGEYFDWPEAEEGEAKTSTTAAAYPQVPLIDLPQGNRLYLSPNPTAQTARVLLPPFVCEGKAQVEVLDMTGRVVQTLPVLPDQTVLSIDVHHLDAGIYIVTLRDNGILLAQSKLAVQH